VPAKDGYIVPYGGTCLHKRINRICEANNLPKVGVHGLRHSFASLAYHLQIPEKIAMEIGGWSDDGTMRKIYTHLAQKDIANRAKDFSNFFIG
jgi:integrase